MLAIRLLLLLLLLALRAVRRLGHGARGRRGLGRGVLRLGLGLLLVVPGAVLVRLLVELLLGRRHGHERLLFLLLELGRERVLVRVEGGGLGGRERSVVAHGRLPDGLAAGRADDGDDEEGDRVRQHLSWE